jgi:hypothetical protein
LSAKTWKTQGQTKDYKTYKRAYDKEYVKSGKKRANRLANPERSILYITRGRAKKKSLEFNLSIEDIKIPEVCPVFKTQLIYGSKNRYNCPSIDRINNDRGYIKGNVAIISRRANEVKSDLNIASVEALLEYMKR